jgi:hypothetical protein
LNHFHSYIPKVVIQKEKASCSGLEPLSQLASSHGVGVGVGDCGVWIETTGTGDVIARKFT